MNIGPVSEDFRGKGFIDATINGDVDIRLVFVTHS